MDQTVLLDLVIIIALGALAQWAGWALRLPSILLLLLTGFLAGPVLGWLEPDRVFGPLLLPFVSVAVALILFEGGMTLRFTEIRGVGHVVGRLVTVGALITWLLAALSAWLTVRLELPLIILLGAILTVTGPTVVLPLLRHIRPTGQAGAILKWEGIVIDPIGAMLAVLVFEMIAGPRGSDSIGFLVVSLLRTLLVGGTIGLAAAALLVLAIRRYWIPDHLQTALALMLVAVALVASNRLQHESGLLAVTVMGIALANQRYADVEKILEFKENLRVFLLSAVFILLSARVRIDDLRAIGPEAALFVVLLVVVVRPVSVWLSTLGCALPWREKMLLSWMAPRGIVAAAVTSVFALALEMQGEPQARLLVPLVFATIVGTVVVYGLTASRLAQALKLSDPDPQGLLIVGAGPFARAFAALVRSLGPRVMLVDTNRAHIARAQMDGLPAFYGSIVGEGIEDKLDLSGIGFLLAMTPNDEVNVLAVGHFARRLSRARVYQLPIGRSNASGGDALDPRLQGRILFRKDAHFDALERWCSGGGTLKKTRLSKTFTYEDFLAQNGGAVLLLGVFREDRKIVLAATDQPLEPQPDQTVIALLSPGFESPDTPT
jgi:NhaP-type Na+/H+ or K+/H+ antiporter